jgi:thiamine transporter ThiT
MNFDFKDFMSFDKMLTPSIIKIIYWIGVVVVVLMGLTTLLGALRFGSLYGFLMGLLWLVLGPILVRVYCELMIVLFNIYGALRDIRDRKQSL